MRVELDVLIRTIAAVALLSLAACAARDPRTPGERERDAEIWSRAHALTLFVASGPTRGCTSLGVVSEHYYDGVPPDNIARPRHMTWPEYVLRFRAAELGANTAIMKAAIDKWRPDPLDQSRDLGEAFVCRGTALAAVSANSRPSASAQAAR